MEDQDPFIPPPPPPQPPIGNPMYPQSVLEAKQREVREDLRRAVIFGVLGLFCCGFILGFLVFRRANHAQKLIDQYGVMADKRIATTVLKILGIFEVVGSIIVLLMKDYSFDR